jgi:uncharacterized protein (TIGR02646 family)
MRNIAKERAPKSLTDYSFTEDASYDGFRAMDELRQALVEEQRGLCCYCTRRIKPSYKTMKVEHWRSRAEYPDLELDYKNLLGACCGGSSSPKAKQHCDTFKGDKRLSRNPAHPDDRVEERICYKSDGTIRSSDPDLDRELDFVLNLNVPELCRDRRAVISALLSVWRRRSQPREVFVQTQLDRLSQSEGTLAPFAPLSTWWLRNKGWQITA